MLSLLGAAMLAATIGAAAGLLATRVPAQRKTKLPSSIAIGVAGAVLAGFVLPLLGAPVSKSLTMGMVTSAIGAALALAAWHLLRNTSFRDAVHLPLFCFAWCVAGGLCFVNAGLVFASMPLATIARISQQTVTVSAIVGIVLAAAGLLVLRIASQVLAVYRSQPREPMGPTIAGPLRGLLTSLILAGIALDAILGLVAVAFLSRIREGFAIFG